jgi:hypothetical protein
MVEKSRFAQLLEEKHINLRQFRETKKINRFTLYTHLHGQIPSNRTAIIYCRLLGMTMDKFYSYLRDDGRRVAKGE